MKVIVDRTKWLRGQYGQYDSYLLREHDGKMCCLGFRCEQLGVSRDDLKGKEMPESVEEWLPEDDWTIAGAGKVAEVNDSRAFDGDAEREAQLIELFAAQGDELVFVN
jgi:hypothetical protein